MKKSYMEKGIFIGVMLLCLLILLTNFRMIFLIPIFVFVIFIIAGIGIWVEDYEGDLNLILRKAKAFFKNIKKAH